VVDGRRAKSLPENTAWRDEGCAYHPEGCLTCPLPYCRYDVEDARFGTPYQDRVALAQKLHREGLSVREIAPRLDRSERAVYCMLARDTVPPPQSTVLDNRPAIDALQKHTLFRKHKPPRFVLTQAGSSR